MRCLRVASAGNGATYTSLWLVSLDTYATQWPSGENAAAKPSSNGVWRNGCATRSRRPTLHKSTLGLEPGIVRKRIDSPSGDQLRGILLYSFASSGAPGPDAS